MSTGKEAKECYTSTLADLTFNSRPMINVLTMLAEENIAHAPDIVEAIESHLVKGQVDVKLPALYLIDCIIKNIGGTYKTLLSQNIVTIFCHVFQVADEKTRGEMFKLRQTWNEELHKAKLCELDVKVNQLDPAWPIVMPQLTNNIHLNPKFLHNSAIPKKSPPITVPSQNRMTSIIANPDLDSSTLDMQKKIILKQKQLLELERKKLELELLQQQVKLQEQMKSSLTNTQPVAVPEEATKVPKVQNILLKPEVAKQLGNTTISTAPKGKSTSTLPSHRLRGGQSETGSMPRIAPVNSALLAAGSSRPIRDPRLLRHQNTVNNSTVTTSVLSTTVNTNVLLESKNSNISETINSNNKNFTSKMSVRDNRTEPRLVANKDSNVSPQSNNNSKSKSLTQSPVKKLTTTSSKQSSNSTETPSMIKTLKSGRVNSKSSSSGSSESGSSKGSTSSLDSPVKSNKSNGKSIEMKTARSTATSPSKHKKKEMSGGSSGMPVRSEKKKEKGSSSKGLVGSKNEKEIKSTIKRDNSPNTGFREVKISKSRNYARRNREASLSPEPIAMDIDLRPSGPPEKQPRLQPDIPEEKVILGSASDLTTPGMDVDLRQLPAIISKKRPSTESPESSSAKKSKMEVFDELFGNEDTDLRQLPTVMSSPSLQERPPTPPPPIISFKSKNDSEDIVEVKIIKKESPKSSNLDLVREKLANATIRSKMNNFKFHVPAEKRKFPSIPLHQTTHEDIDLRNNTDDSINKIIISSADEQCIKTGNMTKEQKTALMNKILAQIENQKLKEAKKTEENIGNISLQPISDEELDADFSQSSDEESSAYRPNIFSDKDERVPPPPHINPIDGFGNFPRNIDIRRGMWRGRPRRGIMPGRGGIRMMRPPGPPENWVRPNGPWRPMVSGFAKPPLPFNPELMDVDNTNSNVDAFDQKCSQGMPPLQETPEIIIVDCANQDNVKSIVIDNESRDIRYYDDTAIVFMDWSDPREISFQDGSRKVFFGEKDMVILSFNEPYKDVNINGKIHRVKFGGPSRELHIDDKWYECFIGGPGIRIELDGELMLVKAEGPTPQVKIGPTKRNDLVAGKVNLIVDAKTVVPVFLDGKLQKFDINGQTHTLKFINSLQMALIDDKPFEVEFGGLPKSFTMPDKRKYYIRFSVLPRGIKPGRINIQGMENISLPVDQNEPALPIPIKKITTKTGADSPERNSNSPLSLQNLYQQHMNSNLLSSLMASSLMPSQSANNLNSSSYQVENDALLEPSSQNPPELSMSSDSTNSTNALPSSLNINELFQKLVATGIVTTVQDTQTSLVTSQPAASLAPSVNRIAPVLPKKDTLSNIKPVNFGKPETLKVRQPALIATLYSGMQCSSCGMRFPPEHSMQYSQHLDWHFRQNRKGKKNIRKASSRRWYYSLSDWKNYEEIEDLEEREKSYFENQQQAQAEGVPDEPEEEVKIPSVSADPTVQDAKCEVCQDRFEQFYNEEYEEWHLRMATKDAGRYFHPLCLEEYKASLANTTYEDISILKDSDKIEDSVIPGLEVSTDVPSKTEQESELAEIVIDDDESERMTDMVEKIEIEERRSEDSLSGQDEEDGDDDDDVIINEVVPEKIDLVDDDRYEDVPTEQTLSIMVKEEPIDDGFVDVEDVIKAKTIDDFKIKSEPIDPDDELQITGEEHLEESKTEKPEITHTEVVTFIDGNMEFDSSVPPASGISGKIKINITKPLPVIAPKESNNKELSSEIEKSAESIDPTQPLPPGEEPIQLNLKPTLQGIKLKKLPPVKKGTELTGLCSIM